MGSPIWSLLGHISGLASTGATLLLACWHPGVWPPLESEHWSASLELAAE